MNNDNKLYINEESQLYAWYGKTIKELDNKKAKATGVFFMDENILCFKNSRDKVVKLFGYEKNDSLDNPLVWKPYGIIAGFKNTTLLGGYDGLSAYCQETARVSWVNGDFTIQTFGNDALEKILLIRDYASGNKTVTALEGQELNEFLGKIVPKKKPKI